MKHEAIGDIAARTQLLAGPMKPGSVRIRRER